MANIITLDTVIIGSGCAGFNAIDTLYDLGERNIALITEGINMGTSRNTGSDKQTYYKLTIASNCNDSIYELAQNLFHGGGVNGDTALVEAACSLRSFMKLVNLGVPFPTNKYGEYVGYKTDHDPYSRATSCGPLTSNIMTRQLEKSVLSKNITIFDNMQVVKFIVSDNKIHGMIAIDLNRISETDMGITLFHVSNVIMATGGPAGVYYTSVYPTSQTGMTGMALEVGAKACNLQEWQYGLASTKFRWNVSGTYQQVLPKYISIDQNGVEREFLLDYFDDAKKVLDMVFLKGYQWPFDIKKIAGSSLIDVIVHHEVFDKGNRVFMDFRTDPTGLDSSFDGLDEVTYHYLSRSNALVSTPIKRLEIMNQKAIELYAKHGIDLYTEPLEISVCAQHNNGGIAVDMNWQSSIQGLYVVGEAAGTFGVYRPGGSALNSTQVGSLRAAEAIVYGDKKLALSEETFITIAESSVNELSTEIRTLVEHKGKSNIIEKRIELQKAMSKNGAHMRNVSALEKFLIVLRDEYKNFTDKTTIGSYLDIPHALKNKDIMLTQIALISAMIKSAKEMGSRGSALLIREDGEEILSSLKTIKYIKSVEGYTDKLVTTVYDSNNALSQIESVRPLELTDNWFETVWNEFNEKITFTD
ncbi:MAG: FAD-binding protein [Oscillospiraceae bacterium]